jgi:hypothetical protein
VVAAQAALICTACARPTRLPDLKVTAVTTSPQAVAAGTDVRLRVTVQNTGPAKAARSRTSYFLVRRGTRIRLGAQSVAAVPPQHLVRSSVRFMVPAGTPGGRFRITACANAGRSVSEASTHNNCRVTGRAVRVLPILPRRPARAFWGARVGTQLTGSMPPWDMSAQRQFERETGKRASLMHWGAPWQACTPGCRPYRFDKTAANNVRKHGSISMYDWAPYAEPGGADQQRRLSLAAISRGDWDGLVRAFATEVRNWGHPLFLRFAWEMNGNWFPWTAGAKGNQPATFVRAWRRVHDLFASVGAKNVVWVWCPNVDPTHTWVPFAHVYPGNAYVDWTCLDGYNWGTNPRGHRTGWQGFEEMYRRSYNELRELAPSKPMMIGEVGSTEFGGSKAAWIREMFRRLPSYPQIKGFSWMNDPLDNMDWPIESSASARAAFRAALRSAYFSTRR